MDGRGPPAGGGPWRLRALLASPGMRPKVYVLGLRLLLFGGAVLLLICSSAGETASVRVEMVGGATLVRPQLPGGRGFSALSYPAYQYIVFVSVALLIANGVFLGIGGVELALVGGGLEGESRRYRIDRLAPIAGVCVDFLLFLFTFSSCFAGYGLTSALTRASRTSQNFNQTAVALLEKDLAWELAASTLMLLAHGLVGACLVLGWLYVLRQRRDALAPLGGGWVLSTFTWLTEGIESAAAEISKSRKYVSLKFANRCLALLFAVAGVAFGRALHDQRSWSTALSFQALFYLNVLFLCSSLLMVTANCFEIERDASATTTTKASADLRWLCWAVCGHDLVATVSLFATACAAAGTITGQKGSGTWYIVGNFAVAFGMLASFSVMLSLYFSATAAKQMLSWEEAQDGGPGPGPEEGARGRWPSGGAEEAAGGGMAGGLGPLRPSKPPL